MSLVITFTSPHLFPSMEIKIVNKPGFNITYADFVLEII